MENAIGWILIVLSIFFVARGVAELLKLAFSRGGLVVLLCLIFPILLLVYLEDERGRKAWGSVSLGLILMVIGWVMTSGT